MLDKLPAQSPPVCRSVQSRNALEGQGHQTSRSGAGVEAAQTVCDNLTGLAQDMCWAIIFGV
jgi:hypothetical protein